MRTEVVVVPTAVWEVEVGAPALGVLRPGGQAAASATVGDPVRTATELAAGVLAEPEPLVAPRLHNMGFEVLPDRVALVFGIAVPWGVGGAPGAEWQQLPERATEPIGRAVREGWRRLAMSTPAATELLPPVFTIPQLRGVYAAVWGQPDRNFHRWVASNPGLLEEVSPAELAAARLVLQNLDGTTPGEQEPGTAQALARFGRDAGPLVLMLLSGMSVGTVAAASYLLARQRKRGKPPEYYRRGPATRLEVPYAMRPAWEGATEPPTEGQTGRNGH